MNEKCSIGNHKIAQLFNSCLNKVNFNKMNELRNLLDDPNFLNIAQNEVNNMEICDIESSLYFFRFKRINEMYENITDWSKRILKNKNINHKILKYIEMLLYKYNTTNVKCSQV
jgi:hypothetical protein